MKKLVLVVVLLLLLLPVKGIFSQENEIKAGEAEGRLAWRPGIWMEALMESQPPAAFSPRQNGEEIYYTHPEFTGVMTRTVTTAAQNTDDGYLFVGALGWAFEGPSALMILDDEGEPVYINTFIRLPFVGDMKIQRVNGVDFLTYQADHLPNGEPYGYSVVMDQSYQVVDTWTMNDGQADVHDFLLLDNGHAILMAYELIPFDLSPYGGPVDGTLVDVVLQEQDASKNVVFEWRATDYLPVGDSQVDVTSDIHDFLHTNAIEVDDDGNWLVSNRHFSEITKINRQTGAIIWRLGGAANEFTFTNDDGFSFQHDIRRLENGNISLFDNGNRHTPPHSRAVEFAIDEVGKTITRVWEYPGDTSEYSFAMGNNQRLPNGNSMIGWGTQNKLTEVESDGTVALEMLLGNWSYRAYRFPWSATPVDPPRVVVNYGADPTAVTVYTSWNGATDITSYEVYAGPTTASMSLVDSVSRDGFETQIDLTGLPSDTCFFKTKPIDAQADPTPFSNIAFRVDLQVCWDQLEHSFMPVARK